MDFPPRTRAGRQNLQMAWVIRAHSCLFVDYAFSSRGAHGDKNIRAFVEKIINLSHVYILAEICPESRPQRREGAEVTAAGEDGNSGNFEPCQAEVIYVIIEQSFILTASTTLQKVSVARYRSDKNPCHFPSSSSNPAPRGQARLTDGTVIRAYSWIILFLHTEYTEIKYRLSCKRDRGFPSAYPCGQAKLTDGVVYSCSFVFIRGQFFFLHTEHTER